MSEEKSLKLLYLLLYQCITYKILLNIHLIFGTERVTVREFDRFGFFACNTSFWTFLKMFFNIHFKVHKHRFRAY